MILTNIFQSPLFILRNYIVYIRSSCTGNSTTKKNQFLFRPETKETVMKLTYNINEKFENIMTSFCAYVLEENVSINILKFVLSGIVRQPTIYEDDETVTHEDVKSNNVSDILPVIRSHCTFFNFKLLENLIALIKYSSGKHMMEEYKRDFCEYAKAIVVSDIPHGIGMEDSEDSYCLVVMLTESFKSCKAMYIDILKTDLCKILKIEEECLYIANTNDGCICIVFQATVSIRNSFPLTEESIKALSSLVYVNAIILRVGYDGQVYDINTDNSEGKTIL